MVSTCSTTVVVEKYELRLKPSQWGHSDGHRDDSSKRVIGGKGHFLCNGHLASHHQKCLRSRLTVLDWSPFDRRIPYSFHQPSGSFRKGDAR